MRRTLVISLALPYPPDSGGSLRTWQNVVALREGGPVAVFGLRADELASPPVPGIEIWRSSADPGVTRPPDEQLDWLRRPGAVPWDRYFSDAVAGEIGQVVADFEPDMLVVEEVMLFRYLEPLRSVGVPVVLDVHGIDSVMNAELARAPGSSRVAKLVRARVADRMATAEDRALGSVDQVWACSEVDAAALRPRSPAPVFVVPNTIDPDAYPEPGIGARARTLVYPAMFGYPPNEQAALMLARDVLPPLAERFPDARLMLIGRSPTPAMRAAAAADPRVEVTGSVPDVRPFYATAGAMAVPLLAGSGTRFKVLEAAACGVPVISTAKGVEGLELDEGVHWLRADRPTEFVHAVDGVWSEPESTRALVAAARVRVHERYSWARAATAIADALDWLPSRPPA